MEQFNHGTFEKITRAIFLMAARDAVNSGPAVVNKLVADSEREIQILSGGEGTVSVFTNPA